MMALIGRAPEPRGGNIKQPMAPLALILLGATLVRVAAVRDDYTWVRGVNYVPSTSHNDVATFQDYDRAQVVTELGYAASAGFNAVRIFLSTLPWLKEAETFKSNLAHLIATLEGLNLTSQLVVFDSCFGDVTANISWIDSGLYKNATWIPNPGPANVANEQTWPIYDRYLADVVSVVGDSKAVLLWDLHNEPDFSVPHMVEFIAHVGETLQSLEGASARPRTVGVASSGQQGLVQDIATLLSFHNYNGGGEGLMLAADIAGQQALADRLGKPLLLTESMSRPNDLLTSVLPAVFGCINVSSPPAPPALEYDEVFLPSGNDLLIGAPGEYSLASAQAFCVGNASCAAFCYSGPSSEIPSSSSVYFKVVNVGVSGNSSWTTFAKPVPLAAAGPVGFFVWELLLGVDQFNENWSSPYQGLIFPQWAGGERAGTFRYADEQSLIASYFAPGPPPCPVPQNAFYPDTSSSWSYSPASAWTAWSGVGPVDGTLHYANEGGAVATLAVSPVARAAAKSASASAWTSAAAAATSAALVLVHKRGPDCGIFSISLNGAVVQAAYDSYDADVNWAAELRVPLTDASQPFVLNIEASGLRNASSSNSYAQVVGLRVEV